MERLHKNKSRFEVNNFWDELWKSTLKIPSQNRKIIGKLWDLWTEVSFLFLLIGISRVGKTLDRSVLLKTEVTFFFYRKQKCPFFNFYGPEVSFSLFFFLGQSQLRTYFCKILIELKKVFFFFSRRKKTTLRSNEKMTCEVFQEKKLKKHVSKNTYVLIK